MKAKRLISALASAALFVQAVPIAFADEESTTVRVVIENTTFTKADGAKWEGTLVDTEVELKDDSTMYSVIVDAVKKQGYEMVSGTGDYGAYISDIGGVGIETASNAEGQYPGWTTMLNDWFTAQSSDAYKVSDKTLEAGDVINVEYTVTWLDLGGSYLDNDTTLKSLEFSDGELDQSFAPDVKEYTLTLKDVDSIKVIPTAANKNFQVKTYKNTYSPDVKGAEYKRSEAVPVADGDKLYIGVGNKNWATMNYGDITENVYVINIKSDTTEADNEAAAEEVEKLIDSIGEVTLDSEDAINGALAAYNRLTDDQKALVDNYSTLEAAVARLAELKAQNKPNAAFEDMFNDTAAALAKTDAVIGNEWKAIGLARANKLPESYKKSMADALREYAATVNDGKFNARRSTENSKESVLAAALGIDPEKLAGQDILSAIKDKDYTAIQGINGQIWANIALTGVGEDPVYRDILLAAQLDSGAFSFDNKTEDVDITAMAITALALDDSSEAKAAVEKAVEWLSKAQGADGSFGNCESTAQVIIALSSVGVDVTKDERFVKDGVSLMDGLALYYLGNGSFSHLADGDTDGLATEQAFLALASYYRYSNGLSPIYDFSDVELKADTAAAPAEDNKGSNPATGAGSGAALITAVCLAFITAKKRSK